MTVKIKKVEAFAGNEATGLRYEASGTTSFTETVVVSGDLGGGLGIWLEDGRCIEIGAESEGGPIEVKLLDADGEPMPEGKMSWSDQYKFTVPG